MCKLENNRKVIKVPDHFFKFRYNAFYVSCNCLEKEMQSYNNTYQTTALAYVSTTTDNKANPIHCKSTEQLESDILLHKIIKWPLEIHKYFKR